MKLQNQNNWPRMLCRACSQSVVSISFKYTPPSLRVISERESSGIIRKLSSFITWVLERRCFARIPCFRNPILQSVHINDRGFTDDKFALASSKIVLSTINSDYFTYLSSTIVARLRTNLTERSLLNHIHIFITESSSSIHPLGLRIHLILPNSQHLSLIETLMMTCTSYLAFDIPSNCTVSYEVLSYRIFCRTVNFI